MADDAVQDLRDVQTRLVNSQASLDDLKHKRVRVKDGWGDSGRLGIAIGEDVFIGQWWTPVLWDDAEDPDFFKTAGIQVLVQHWK